MEIDDKYCRECGKEMVLRVKRKRHCARCGNPNFEITLECPERMSFWGFLKGFHTLVRSYHFGKGIGGIICPTCKPDIIKELSDEYPEQLPPRVIDLAIMGTDDSS